MNSQPRLIRCMELLNISVQFGNPNNSGIHSSVYLLILPFVVGGGNHPKCDLLDVCVYLMTRNSTGASGAIGKLHSVHVLTKLYNNDR